MATLLKRKASNKNGTVRYAVVGLGYFAQAAILPAFEHAAENSELIALVSDDPAKLEQLSKKYGVARVYSYEQYETCLASGEVDAVYIALPNNLHCEYTLRAAGAGVHVLCEKPMAITVQECEAMINAAEEHQVKLMIAYRLHFEEANMRAVELVKSGKLGAPRIFNSTFSMQVEEGNIRLDKDLGGGTVYDIGIYCINAARYLFQDEPIEVFAYSANNGEKRFKEVDEMTSAILRFPNERLAAFTCSFGAADVSAYRMVGAKGDLRVEPAYEFAADLKHYLTIDGKTTEHKFEKRDQVAAELMYFSKCILENKNPEPSGMEGLADVRVIRALLQSVEKGKPVRLEPLEWKRKRPTLAQEIKLPPVPEMPELIHAETPSGN